MERTTERTILKVVLGSLVVLLLGVSTLLVTAISTGKSPADVLFPISKHQAVSIAQNTVQGTVQEVEAATSTNPVYEVEVQQEGKETDVRVDAHTGNVLSVEEEDEAEDVPITGTALERASAVALAYIGEGRVTDTEIGDEEGYYEIEITKDNGHEVDVHLDETFNVLSVEN